MLAEKFLALNTLLIRKVHCTFLKVTFELLYEVLISTNKFIFIVQNKIIIANLNFQLIIVRR